MVNYLNKEKETLILEGLSKEELNLQNFLLEITKIMYPIMEKVVSRDELTIFFIYKGYLTIDFKNNFHLLIGENNVGQHYGEYKNLEGKTITTIYFPYSVKKKILLTNYLEIEEFFSKISINSKYLSKKEVSELASMIEKGSKAEEIVLKFKKNVRSLRESYNRYQNGKTN